MNSLLRLEFFKSLGFPSKEVGMLFIKENKKLSKEIESKVNELEDEKYNIIEYIKENIFSKYEEKKEVYLMRVKSERYERILEKKELKKRELKSEMREEILREIRDEERSKKREILMKKYGRCVPVIKTEISSEDLEELFISVINKVECGEIDKDEMKVLEKLKEQVEKSINVIIKAREILKKY